MSSRPPDDYTPPEPTTEDSALVVAKAGLGLIPGIATLSTLLDLVFESPLEARRLEWMKRVGSAIVALEARGISPEQLRDNPVFFDCVFSASQAAIRTSQEAKRDALRNAIINAGLPGAPDVVRQQMFIGLVDRFTAWHLQILRLFQNPKAVLGDRRTGGTGNLGNVIKLAYPEIDQQRELRNLIWADLQSAGLHDSGPLSAIMSESGTMVKRTTDLGDEFVRFITDPL